MITEITDKNSEYHGFSKGAVPPPNLAKRMECEQLAAAIKCHPGQSGSKLRALHTLCEAFRQSAQLAGPYFLRWGFPAVLLTASLLAGSYIAGWLWIWLIALALFFGAKWLTVCSLRPSLKRVCRRRLLAYLFLWPGMDAASFFAVRPVAVPRGPEWLAAAGKMFVGAALLWVAVRFVDPTHALLRGWVGMTGIILLFHFGGFHLLSVFWRALGIDAKPIMQSPVTSTSLATFWSGRWNTAFHDLVYAHSFKPLVRHLGPRMGLLAVFLISGLVHELVISVPARGGYGLPTLYFLVQGLALLFERSKFGRKLGLGSGLKGWCFLGLVTAGPAFWLFNPTFVHNVVVPMLNAIGAI